MKKYLFIGLADQPHLIGLALYLKKKDPTCSIEIIAILSPRSCDAVYDKVYKLRFYYWYNKKFEKGTYFIFHLSIRVLALFLRKKYDVIELHYVALFHKALINCYKRLSKCIVAVLWGSDIFRLSVNMYPPMREFLLKCDKINCGTEPMYAKVKEIVGEDLLGKQISHCRFGLDLLNDINLIKRNKFSKTKLADILCVDKFNDKIRVITIGSNASAGQQHLKIIQSLISHHYKDVIFLFPLTYGKNDAYINEIKHALEKMKQPYFLFTEFMPPKQLAALRLISDIFVQLQITDALSGAMQEHMYAESIVITGSWLPYGILKENMVYFETIDRIEQIGDKVSECINNYQKKKKLCVPNPDAIWKLAGWENCIDSWLEL